MLPANYAETLSSSTAYPRPSTDDHSSSGITSRPSLILAFLALGFFTMAMGFVIGFRRYQYTHQSRRRNNNASGRQQSAVSPLDEEIRKPKLWDVLTDTTNVQYWGCAAPNQRIQGNHWRWENIMPLSATEVANSNPVPAKGCPSSCHNPNALERIRESTTGHAFLSSLEDQEKREHPIGVTTMQIEVAIEMPCSHYLTYVKELNETGSGAQREIDNYVIGICECPWNDSNVK